MLKANTLVKANGGEMESKGRNGMKGIVISMNPNHNYKVEWENGKTWSNVALSNLEKIGVNYEVGTEVYVTLGVSKVKAVVKALDKWSETIKVDLNGQVLDVKKIDVISVEDANVTPTPVAPIVSEEIEVVPEEEVIPSQEEDHVKYPYSSQVLLNPDKSIVIGLSKVDYSYSNKRLKLRVYGQRVSLEEVLKVLLADENIKKDLAIKHKSPYKTIETTNNEGVHFIKRAFLNKSAGMVEQESLGLRFKEDANGATLYGYQQVYILDLLMALEKLEIATKDGDGYSISLPNDYSKESLEANGYTVPSSYNA